MPFTICARVIGAFLRFWRGDSRRRSHDESRHDPPVRALRGGLVAALLLVAVCASAGAVAGATAITSNRSAGTTSGALSPQAVPPTVTSISPTAGPGTGGTSVTITGTNFSGATAVTFGATAATGFTVNSTTKITATSPQEGAGHQAKKQGGCGGIICRSGAGLMSCAFTASEVA